MNRTELKDERDRDHARRDEKRHRVATYKDKPKQPKQKIVYADPWTDEHEY